MRVPQDTTQDTVGFNESSTGYHENPWVPVRNGWVLVLILKPDFQLTKDGIDNVIRLLYQVSS